MATFKKAKVTPTARASMLVATASISTSRRSNPAGQQSPSSWKASQTIFPPIQPSSRKAIQWSMLVMYPSNCRPRAQPSRGMRA